MPTQDVYDALPEEKTQVMQRARISPVINRRRHLCYRCDACGYEWSERGEDSWKLWWACPRGCNWDTHPTLATVMRQRVRRLAEAWTVEQTRRQQPPQRSELLTLEEWSQAVDRLVAEVQAHQGDESRESRM